MFVFILLILIFTTTPCTAQTPTPLPTGVGAIPSNGNFEVGPIPTAVSGSPYYSYVPTTFPSTPSAIFTSWTGFNRVIWMQNSRTLNTAWSPPSTVCTGCGSYCVGLQYYQGLGGSMSYTFAIDTNMEVQLSFYAVNRATPLGTVQVSFGSAVLGAYTPPTSTTAWSSYTLSFVSGFSANPILTFTNIPAGSCTGTVTECTVFIDNIKYTAKPRPSGQPTSQPSRQPSSQPSTEPSLNPTCKFSPASY